MTTEHGLKNQEHARARLGGVQTIRLRLLLICAGDENDIPVADGVRTSSQTGTSESWALSRTHNNSLAMG